MKENSTHGEPNQHRIEVGIHDVLYEKLLQIGDFLSSTNCPLEEMQAMLNFLEEEGMKDPLTTIAKCDLILNPPILEDIPTADSRPEPDLEKKNTENTISDFDFERVKWEKMRTLRESKPIKRRKKFRY